MSLEHYNTEDPATGCGMMAIAGIVVLVIVAAFGIWWLIN